MAGAPDRTPLAPTADAGGPYEVDLGDEVTLDGSASISPDELPLTYTWDLSEVGGGDAVEGETVTVTPTADGTFEVTLTVTDTNAPALSDSDTATITVADAPDPGPDPSRAPPAMVSTARRSPMCRAARRTATTSGASAGYGIAQGFPDGTFRPANSVTRDQMTSFIARMLEVAGVDLPADADDAFDDDDGGAHEAATNALFAAGIVEGRADGSFDPRGSVTRGQMASFLIRGLEYALDTDLAPEGDNPFGDTDGSPHTDNITVANELGIALGRTSSAFEPNDDVRRDQMGSFIARTLDVMVAEGFELTPLG